jgi:thymidylate synthase (FAD)
MNNAKIIAVTQPLIRVEKDNGDMAPMTVGEFVAYVARVSNPSNQNNTLTAPKLLRYLVKNKHWSPFEMVNVVMEIETTRDIARQILRHRSFSFQEFSQRYADPTKDLGFETREARLQDPKNRQNSIEGVDSQIDEIWYRMQSNVIAEAEKAYGWAISKGIAKEQARAVLPEGLTVSRMYMNGTLRSWVHYCVLRMDNGTQKEHREIAKEAWVEITKYFPDLNEIELI